MTKSETKKSKEMCFGCYNDDYNHGLGGAKECWNFASATVEPRIAVHINQAPPYEANMARPMLSCYNRPQWCYVSPNALRSDGYWK